MRIAAATLARGWLSVYTAASSEAARPQMYRTVSVERHAHGLRLAATDSYIVLHAWVPERDYELDPIPELDEVPVATAVAIDTWQRGQGLLSHLLKLATSEDATFKDLDVIVQLNVPFERGEESELTLEGLEARAVTIEHPDHERVQLEVYDGVFPSWKHLVAAHKPVRTNSIAFSADIVSRLAKATRPHNNRLIRWWFGGQDNAAAIAFGEEPEVSGLVMPCRWDFEKNAPWSDPKGADE